MAGLGDKVRLAALPLALVAAWLSASGCAGQRAYVPFERETKLSTVARWQALEDVAKREKWNVVRSDAQAYTIVAYSNPSGASGVRDRIKVELLSDRTVVETRSEIEDQGRWEADASRCASYASVREKLLAAQIESRGEPAGSAGGVPSREGLGAAAAPSVASTIAELAAR
jgi:hypothetical protein